MFQIKVPGPFEVNRLVNLEIFGDYCIFPSDRRFLYIRYIIYSVTRSFSHLLFFRSEDRYFDKLPLLSDYVGL